MKDDRDKILEQCLYHLHYCIVAILKEIRLRDKELKINFYAYKNVDQICYLYDIALDNLSVLNFKVMDSIKNKNYDSKTIQRYLSTLEQIHKCDLQEPFKYIRTEKKVVQKTKALLNNTIIKLKKHFRLKHTGLKHSVIFKTSHPKCKIFFDREIKKVKQKSAKILKKSART